MAKKFITSINNEVIDDVTMKTILRERYLAYALSTIMDRALPDVRDGLKPVHRRIIYAMYLLKLNPEQSYAKCARIVGDVMGKFHPHGDASIYDALVRLAQDFTVRYPLIDGQGNFGNIDGDNAAAMRYTEARMTHVASYLLQGLKENAIDFKATYNEEDLEPVVLPSAFPNLLANGSSGIAVGMATNIPPHNVYELCNAAQYLIQNPDAQTNELLNYIKGPDFPTGGILLDNQEQILENYTHGKGFFRLRARWHKEQTKKNNYVIVITQIPYQIQKSRLIEKTAELLISKKLPMLENIQDESAEDIRIVLEPKSHTIDAGVLMESVFRLTDFETRVSLNLNVLVEGKIPKVLSLKNTIQNWLDHRKNVLIRRTEFRKKEIDTRLELLEGYLIAFLNLDEIIRIIREEDDAKKSLISQYNLTENQAEAILNMRLRSLRRLEEIELKKEHEQLTKERFELEGLLKDTGKQWRSVSSEIEKIKRNYPLDSDIGKRRTSFEKAPIHNLEDIREAMIEKNPVTIILSEKGWLRSVKGHITDFKDLSFKEGDQLKFALAAYTTDKISLLSTKGKFFTIDVHNIFSGRGHGDPIRILIDLEADQEICQMLLYENSNKLLLVSKKANGFILPQKETLSSTKKGKQIFNIKDEDQAYICRIFEGDTIAVVGENRKMLLFPANQLPIMSKGKGVRLQKYKDGNILDATSFFLEENLSWKDSAGRVFSKNKEELKNYFGERAAAGSMVPRGFPHGKKIF